MSNNDHHTTAAAEATTASSSAPSTNSPSKIDNNDNNNNNNTKEDWELQRDAHKVLGDAAFRSGQHYDEAVRHYTQALSLDPTHCALLSNRSAAHLKLSHKSKALHDARDCVRHHPDFVKGHARLAAALHALRRWEAAVEEYQVVLRNDAGNVAAKKGMEECKAQDKKQQQQEEEEEEELQEKQQQEQEAVETKASVEKPATEDDLLDEFFTEVEDVTKPKPPDSNNNNKEQDDDDDNDENSNNHRRNAIRDQRTDLGSAEEQIARLLAPNYQWRNLNPLHVLDLSHEATPEDISTRYKALSLLLHPDKCSGKNVNVDRERAKEAYDQVQASKTQLNDPQKLQHVKQLIAQGRRQGKQDWKQQSKDRRNAEALEEYRSRAVQRIFAEIEYKRRQVEERERKQEQRERDQEEEELKKERDARTFDKQWREETRVENRIGSWRDFQKKRPAKKQKL